SFRVQHGVGHESPQKQVAESAGPRGVDVRRGARPGLNIRKIEWYADTPCQGSAGGATRSAPVASVSGAKVLAPVFVGHEIYRQPAYGSNHPLAIPRVERVIDLCRALGWLREDEFCLSPRASRAELARFHDAEYIEALHQATRQGRVDP